MVQAERVELARADFSLRVSICCKELLEAFLYIAIQSLGFRGEGRKEKQGGDKVFFHYSLNYFIGGVPKNEGGYPDLVSSS